MDVWVLMLLLLLRVVLLFRRGSNRPTSSNCSSNTQPWDTTAPNCTAATTEPCSSSSSR